MNDERWRDFVQAAENWAKRRIKREMDQRELLASLAAEAEARRTPDTFPAEWEQES